MFYKKKGTPEVGELVLCTVKRILYHSVFTSIDEYENKEGMIHISEIAPGRIRNLSDYVREGKRIVCKVLNINSQGNIDLSLRRVGTGLMIKKLNEHKQEEKAEKLLENVGKEFGLDIKGAYSKLGDKAIEKYGTLHNFFQAIVQDDKKASEELNIDQKFWSKLVNTIKDKIKPSEAVISRVFTLKTFESNGISIIKKILSDLEKQGFIINYLGAPRYKLQISAPDYKKANTILDSAAEKLILNAKKIRCEISFNKND